MQGARDASKAQARLLAIQTRLQREQFNAMTATPALLLAKPLPLLKGLTAEKLVARNRVRADQHRERRDPKPANPRATHNLVKPGTGRATIEGSRELGLQFGFVDDRGAARPPLKSAEWRQPTRVYTWGAEAKGKAGLCRYLLPVDGQIAVHVTCGPASTISIGSAGQAVATGDHAVVDASAACAGQLQFRRAVLPEEVKLPIRVADLAAGNDHCAAIEPGSGALYTWGDKRRGRLGRSDTTARSEAATNHLRARDNSRVGSRWGIDSASVTSATRYSLPALVPALLGRCVVSVSCGNAHTIVSDSTGCAWAWGKNDAGQCGVAARAELLDVLTPRRAILMDSRSPPPIQGATARSTPAQDSIAPRRQPRELRVFAVAAGDEHSALLTSDGCLWTAGRKEEGRLGVGLDSAAPLRDKARATRHASWAAPLHGVASRNGERPGRRCSEYQASEDIARRWFMRVIGIPMPLVDVSCGGAHTIGLDVDGRPWAFGSARFGQTAVPAPVLDADDAMRVAADLAIESKEAHRARAAASSAASRAFGAVKRMVTEPHLESAGSEVPREIRSLAMRNAIIGSVAAGWATSAAVDHRGRLWTWGTNMEGTLARSAPAWARHRPGIAELPTDAACVSAALGKRHGASVCFQRPIDLSADPKDPDPAVPLWESLVERGVPVSTWALDRIPRDLHADWGARTRQRLRAIRFTRRIAQGAQKLERKRRLIQSEHRRRALERRTDLQQLGTDRLSVGLNHAALSLEADESARSRLGPLSNHQLPSQEVSCVTIPRSHPPVADTRTKRFRFRIPERQREHPYSPVPLQDIPPWRVIPSTLYLLHRLNSVRRSSPLDDSVVGLHQAATVAQHACREYLGRRRANAARIRRLRGAKGLTECRDLCALEAAGLARRLIRARATQRHKLVVAHQQREERIKAQVLAATTREHLETQNRARARAMDDLLKAAQEAESNRRNMDAQRQRRAAEAAKAHRQLIREQGEAETGDWALDLTGELAKAEAEQQAMGFEDELSKLAAEKIWKHADEHAMWREGRSCRQKLAEMERMERACMAVADAQSRAYRRYLLDLKIQAIRDERAEAAQAEQLQELKHKQAQSHTEVQRIANELGLDHSHKTAPIESKADSNTKAESEPVPASASLVTDPEETVNDDPAIEQLATASDHEESVSWIGYEQDGWIWDGWRWIYPAAHGE